jgi:hypothetical protein
MINAATIIIARRRRTFAAAFKISPLPPDPSAAFLLPE